MNLKIAKTLRWNLKNDFRNEGNWVGDIWWKLIFGKIIKWVNEFSWKYVCGKDVMPLRLWCTDEGYFVDYTMNLRIAKRMKVYSLTTQWIKGLLRLWCEIWKTISGMREFELVIFHESRYLERTINESKCFHEIMFVTRT